jgi:hypothetical protein
MNKKLKKEKINLEIFEENGKVGIRGKGKDEGKIFVEPIYDYDEALLGSYYVDPEYWGNYYLYRFTRWCNRFPLLVLRHGTG